MLSQEKNASPHIHDNHMCFYQRELLVRKKTRHAEMKLTHQHASLGLPEDLNWTSIGKWLLRLEYQYCFILCYCLKTNRTRGHLTHYLSCEQWKERKAKVHKNIRNLHGLGFEKRTTFRLLI